MESFKNQSYLISNTIKNKIKTQEDRNVQRDISVTQIIDNEEVKGLC